jgi:RNA polymerase sigma-70 factor, ECF subfamily
MAGPGVAEFEELYRRRFSAFARVAIAITANADIGLESVQDGFARAIERRQTFRGECPLEAWVWKIVVNAARTAATRNVRVGAEPGDERAAEGNGHHVVSEVEMWVRTLPERQRLVVFLRYWADLDYRAIAEALEIEVGTVSATLSAAHQRLRRVLQEVPK